jgi:hypothetical protein
MAKYATAILVTSANDHARPKRADFSRKNYWSYGFLFESYAFQALSDIIIDSLAKTGNNPLTAFTIYKFFDKDVVLVSTVVALKILAAITTCEYEHYVPSHILQLAQTPLEVKRVVEC